MLETSSSLYKLIILEMLEESPFSLSNSEISDFMIREKYTSYMALQELLSDMVASGLLSVKTSGHTTLYTSTEKGRQTLFLFPEALSDGLKEDIRTFLSGINRDENGNVTESSADYSWDKESGYTVGCSISENGQPYLQMKLSVPSESAARVICENWKKKGREVYTSLIQILS